MQAAVPRNDAQVNANATVTEFLFIAMNFFWVVILVYWMDAYDIRLFSAPSDLRSMSCAGGGPAENKYLFHDAITWRAKLAVLFLKPYLFPCPVFRMHDAKLLFYIQFPEEPVPGEPEK
jgi:hypothetical protein